MAKLVVIVIVMNRDLLLTMIARGVVCLESLLILKWIAIPLSCGRSILLLTQIHIKIHLLRYLPLLLVLHTLTILHSLLQEMFLQQLLIVHAHLPQNLWKTGLSFTSTVSRIPNPMKYMLHITTINISNRMATANSRLHPTPIPQRALLVERWWMVIEVVTLLFLSC
jgi:hypothetical protein